MVSQGSGLYGNVALIPPIFANSIYQDRNFKSIAAITISVTLISMVYSPIAVLAYGSKI